MFSIIILKDFFCFLIITIPVLLSVAYLTLAERKIMGSIQQRLGPNVVGFFGVMQPFADGLKLFLKETIIPSNVNTFNFLFSPILGLMLSLFSWAFIPFSFFSFFIDIDLSFLFILAISSLNVYSILLSGWSSNSRYAFFGALRSTAQMISYELSISLVLICVFFCVGSLNIIKIVNFQKEFFLVFALFPVMLQFLINALAETNRAPFDLPEAESELVSGFNVEYSAMGFAFFFLAEYSSMILMSALFILLFLGGWYFTSFSNSLLFSIIVFSLKICLIIFFFIWVRASFPRYRIDQLMRLCWKIFLPVIFCFIFIYLTYLHIENGNF